MPHENGHFTWGNDLGAATMTFSWVHHDIVMVCDHGGTRDILLGFFPIVNEMRERRSQKDGKDRFDRTCQRREFEVGQLSIHEELGEVGVE